MARDVSRRTEVGLEPAQGSDGLGGTEVPAGNAPGTTNFWSSVCSMSVVVSTFEDLTAAILRER